MKIADFKTPPSRPFDLVLYMDVYGFSAQVKSLGEKESFRNLGEAHKHIKSLVAAINNNLDSWCYLRILSDSIFLIAKDLLPEDNEKFWKFYTLIQKSIECLIHRGFIPRGGMSCGEISLEAETMIGMPVINAVKIDEALKIPCVVIPTHELQFELNEPERQLPTQDGGLLIGTVIMSTNSSLTEYKNLAEKNLKSAMASNNHKVCAAYVALIDLIAQYQAEGAVGNE